MEQLVYPVVSAGLEAGGATAGAALGAAGGPVGTMLGAGVGGAAGRALDPVVRSVMGMQQQSTGQYLTDVGIAAGANSLMEVFLNPVNKFLGVLNRKHIFYGDFSPPTATERGQLQALAEGSMIAGTYGTPQEAFPSPASVVDGSRGMRNSTFRTWMNDVSNVSLGGAQIAERRVRDFQVAKDALATDMIRRLGEEGALSDPSVAANVIRELTANRFQASREFRRALFDGAGNMPGALNDLDSTTLLHTFNSLNTRLDVGSVTAGTDRRFQFTDSDILSHLVRQDPVSNATPIGTSVHTPEAQSLTRQGFIRPYTFQGINPNNGLALLGGTYAQTGTTSTVPVPLNTLTFDNPVTTYRQLAELRSTLGYVARENMARARGAHRLRTRMNLHRQRLIKAR